MLRKKILALLFFFVLLSSYANAFELKSYVAMSLDSVGISDDDELVENVYSLRFLNYDSNDDSLTATLGVGVRTKVKNDFHLRFGLYKTFGKMMNEKGEEKITNKARNNYLVYADKKFENLYDLRLFTEYEFFENTFGYMSYGLGYYKYSYKYDVYSFNFGNNIDFIFVDSPFLSASYALGGGNTISWYSGNSYSRNKFHHSLGFGCSTLLFDSFEAVADANFIFGESYSKNMYTRTAIEIHTIFVLRLGINYLF